MIITIEDFYSQLRAAVQYYPEQDKPCLRPNTFRVLAYDQDIRTDTAGATICDADKPYFFSRNWDANQTNPNEISAPLPIVTAFVLSGSLGSPFAKNSKGRYNLVVAVWDKYDQDKTTKNCDACETRSPNEVQRDTAEILKNVLFYLNGVILATTDVDSTPRLYHKDLLAAMVTSGAITSFTQIGLLMNSQVKGNEEIEFRPVDRVAELLFGTAAILNFYQDNCASVEWDFTLLDFGVLAQEAGCKNCG